ncbi:hypothetical protein RhiirA1_215003 [Rhizophagus irregularis]|uniref:Mso1 N-terminal domain-containing protein n=1 Tax=Rhizophagus irregularis TaxID=588596 RepID=A0A2N0RN49_9GLOM|nr:hypothetical protein RhiirA1_215003 [Rhizophagus irregularis]CAB4400899.1 unnamed protein product [Rhizophagus irregularis]CAB4490058.1 unnamed protein product [Rhizophagus irregularis]CAB5369943.1 unnamed protein product [Rhizophagus irregularis]CAB5390157.1 unnamed protein product [Rhizophagus irregularis]
MVEIIDYRISRIVVLCKDCGQDVGLYPARHKCGIPTSEGLPAISKDSSSKNSKSNLYNNPMEGYNLWNKFVNSATAIYNVDDDSDNESEKGDWDGETHISRILREYYESKGADLPDWLYDSDSKYNSDSTKNSYVSQIERTSTKPNRNGNKDFSPLLNVNNNRGRQNGSQRDISLISPAQNHTPAKMNRGRDKSAPPPSSFDRNNIQNNKYHENFYPPLPKNIDSRRITDDQINHKSSNYNSLRRQPPPFPVIPDDYNTAKRLIPSKKSYNQLNYNNTLNKVSPNRDIRVGSGYNNNNNVQKGIGRQGIQSKPLSGSHVLNRNRVQGNYF